jgi:glutamyl/glutaminyl-tRNA synthetase
MNITRFSPTTNGALHLGHIFTLIFNEQFAHQSGGKFYVRFDDTSNAVTLEMEHPERSEDIIKRQKEDIEWLGVNVDGWQKQSDIIDEVHEILSKNKKYAHFNDPYPHDMPVAIRMNSSWVAYPYVPEQTSTRVIMDNMLGITHVIRGDDFLTEYSLYRYFCDLFELPAPQFIHLPKLAGIGGDISKTSGGYTLAELRSCGYNKDDILHILKTSCLLWYNNDWSLYNLKQYPRIKL